MRTTLECLSDYDPVLLRAIAERRGVEPGTAHQPDMAAEIADAILATDSVAEALAWLSSAEREALDLLMANGGRMRIRRFEQRAGPIRRFGPGRLAREAPWRSPASAAEGLWYRGMIGRAFAEEAGTTIEFAFVPSDLRPLLPPPQVRQAPFTVPEAEALHRTAPGDAGAVDDLCTLLSLAYASALSQSEGQLSRDAVERAVPRLLDPDPERAQFLYHLSLSAGLLRAQGHAVQLAREPVRAWLSQPRTGQLRVLQDTWRDDEAWNDLWHVPTIRCEETGWRNDPVAGRVALLQLVGHCPPGAWLSIPGFVETVRVQAVDYLRPNGDFESWYIRDARSGAFLTGLENWEQVEGALLAWVLAGPLHWLGAVSLGYREGWEKATAFSITPPGAAFLGGVEPPDREPPTGAAHVAPDATVSMPRAASLSDRFQLARVAEWRASGAEYAYAITPASLGHALSAGVELPRIERFLARISGDEVPAAALARLRAWASRYGDVRMRHVAVLETRSAQVMAELRAHERIRAYLRQALSPTMAVVRGSDWDALIQELHRAGYLPEIVEH
ncbi:MAG: helicase-associated domain-containing protein [Anaerolineae bacterium]|nr:helicase-associated domain-containing protein [Anaerolineae bacterium]